MLARCRTVKDVVESGLCTGCGLCEAIGGAHKTPMRHSPEGLMRPLISGRLDAKVERRIMNICPGVRVNGQAPDPNATISCVDDDFGSMSMLARGYAGDAHIRHIGSSGGTLTALGIFLLESGMVERILHVRASPKEPARSEPLVSDNQISVIEAAGSRYGPVAPLTEVLELLDAGTRFALIAKPCDIAAVRNLGLADPRVAVQIPYMLTFICGGVPHFSNTQRFIARYGIKEENVTILRYRGYGWPGPLHIETRDGQIFEESFKDTWCGTEPYTLQFRCKICPDSVGLSADIVIADPWLPEAPRKEFRDGWSAVIGRTRSGHDLLAKATASGSIVLEPYSLQELRDSQVYHTRRRAAIVARLAGMLFACMPIPRFRRMRLWKVALRQGLRFNVENMRGTYRRIRAGSGREHVMQNGVVKASELAAQQWDASEGKWI